MLEAHGFAVESKPEWDYVREELKLEGLETTTLTERFAQEAAAALKSLSYNLRQRTKNA